MDAITALPKLPAPASPAQPRPDRRSRRRYRLLGVLVLVLAFLAASFLARNSDLWFHLAAGRLLAHGQFAFGADPFAYTTAGAYWANHAWLFDLLLYALYGWVGGVGLVVLKALLVTALAALLLRMRRPGGAGWVPVVCTALAVLAMSPRLLLQPACVSYFLLGLTFWLLWRPHAEGETRRQGDKETRRRGLSLSPCLLVSLSPYLALPAVFALWVNLDEWFLLGPALAALFWVGERLQGRPRTPGWIVAAGLAACLLNPYTYHAFTLPADLSAVPWTSGLRQDPRFQALFASPWQAAHLRAAADLNAAALAYFALTLLGLLSFLAYRPALRGWRLTVWLPFALLAAWQARAIPFFAVVAAPVTALNLQDFLAAHPRPATGLLRRAAAQAGRLALALTLLGLIGLCWPGWLAGYGREERHVAWGIEAEPSLQRAAEALGRWRSEGLLRPEERVFAGAPEVAHYGAWFCPGEQFFFDHRYPLFGAVVRDYEALCRALQPGAADEDGRRLLREHGIGVVVVYDRDPQRMHGVLQRLGGDAKGWTLLEVAGQAVLFGRNEARPPGGFAPLALDAARLALGPPGAGAGHRLPAAPTEGPAHLPGPRPPWGRLARPPAPPSWESPAASAYLDYFDASAPWQRRRQLREYLLAYAAGLTGVAAPPAMPRVGLQLAGAGQILTAGAAEDAQVPTDRLGPYFAPVVERSPALPLLAVRAARRAVAADPEDAEAWLRLGQAYVLLRDVTSARSEEGRLPPLDQLRSIQIATALEQALRLDPDLETAHHELAYLYGGHNGLDQSLFHYREDLRLSRRAGRRPGETDAEGAYRLELLARDVNQLEEMVQKAEDHYAFGSRQLAGSRLKQARLALDLGLARRAADDILLPCPADLLGGPGMELELELLLSLGRAEDVRGILADPKFRGGRGVLPFHELPPPAGPDGKPLYPVPYHWPAYEWLHVLQSAAVGDYAEAREELGVIRTGLRHGDEHMKRDLQGTDVRGLAMLPWMLSGPPPFLPAFGAREAGRFRQERRDLEIGEPVLRAQQADLCVLEGLLALEEGATDEARAAFAEARQLTSSSAGEAVPFAGAPAMSLFLYRGSGGEKPTGP